MLKKKTKQETIKWLPWHKNSFDTAKKENKPVLLHLSAVWCHWCHRMDHDSYSKKQIIELINRCFIAIRVDIDQRPDIRDRYNFGGFPSTVFLTEKAEVITGHTYVKPRDMLQMLAQISTQYQKLKEQVKKKHEAMQEKKLLPTSLLNYEAVKNVLENIKANFDETFGGFGTQPKFPQPSSVELALLQYAKTKDSKFAEIGQITFKGMLGLFDKVENGFYRYSVTPDWTIPHYEKMLETNAELIKSYINGHTLLKHKVGNEFKDIAEKAIEYILENLTDENKAFYSSQDADEDYYKSPRSVRKKIGKPYIDKTIFTDLNAMMITSLLRAAVVLNNKEYKEHALATLQYLIKNNTNKSILAAGMSHFTISEKDKNNNSDLVTHTGLLVDQVYTLRALIDAFEVTQDLNYLQQAEELFQHIKTNFHDEKDKAFYDKTIQEEDIGYLQFKDKPLIDNSVLADCLVKLHILASKEEYKKYAEGILKAFNEDYSHQGFNAASYALALEHFLFPIKITIVAKEFEQVKTLLNLTSSMFEPRKSIKVLTNKKEIEKEGYELQNTPTIYLCYGVICSRPLKSFEEMKKEFDKIRAKL
jgi:uncharacterized protein